MPPSKPHYRAFISYSHRDAKWAQCLHRDLERYVVPVDAFAEDEKLAEDGTEKSRRLTPIFRDRDDLPASGSLSDTIRQALESSENLIVLCSPNSAASQYVNAEIEIFRGLHPDNEKKIYALIIEGEPPECFPPALIADGAEPIAADAREIGDGKADAKLKLIAGMLGVGFDRLKRREAKRQRNRLLIMVSVVSAIAVMTSALAWWALRAENEATKQKELAEQRQSEAEEARQATERALVREETQRKLAEQSARESKAVLKFLETKVLAAARPKKQSGGLGADATIYDAIEATEPQIGKAFADQPLVEASIRDSLGNTYFYLGQGKPAILQYERALELRKKELGLETLSTLNSMSSLASAYWKTGRHEESLSLREKTLERKTIAIGAEHPSTLLSMNDLAVSYRMANRFQEAVDLQEKSLELHRKIMGPHYPNTLSSMANLGGTYLVMGRHEDALALNEKTLKLLQKVLGAEHPNTLSLMENLAVSYSKVNRHEEALALQEQTLKLKKKVLGTKHPDTLKLMNSLAYHYRKNGQLTHSEKLYQDYLDASQEQPTKDWRFYFAQSSLGAVLAEQKQYAKAEPLLLSGHQGLKNLIQDIKIEWVKISIQRIATFYEDWGKPEKAAKWQVKVDAFETSDKSNTAAKESK